MKAKSTKKKASKGAPIGVDRRVINKELGVFGTRSMGIYADEVNLGRAIPDLMDGLKPVQRRIMYAAANLGHDFVKTARVVGEVIGRYHPHGDVSVANAITTIVQSPTPTILGKGGWGNLIDPASAMRYTNCSLSEYGRSFFMPNYINKEVTNFVPNYDGTTVEPVSLPAMLPNVLLNGGEGIGVGTGTTTNLPMFTAESVCEVLVKALKGEKMTNSDIASMLKFQSRWGGHLVKSKENRAAWLEMFTGSSASVQFESTLIVDRDHKAIEIDDWPPGLDPIKFIDKIRLMKECKHAFNHKGATGFRIEADKGINYQQFDSFLEKVQKATRVRRAFKINVTHRQSSVDDGIVSYKTEYLSLSIPQLLLTWLRGRIALELKSLEFRSKKQNELIAYSKLLIYASTKLDVIFKGLRQKDSRAYLMKHLKLSQAQADKILDLQVRQLSALDQDAIKKKLKDQNAHLAQLTKWAAKPKLKVLDDLTSVMAAIEKDRKFEAAKSRKMNVK